MCAVCKAYTSLRTDMLRFKCGRCWHHNYMEYNAVRFRPGEGALAAYFYGVCNGCFAPVKVDAEEIPPYYKDLARERGTLRTPGIPWYIRLGRWAAGK